MRLGKTKESVRVSRSRAGDILAILDRAIAANVFIGTTDERGVCDVVLVEAEAVSNRETSTRCAADSVEAVALEMRAIDRDRSGFTH